MTGVTSHGYTDDLTVKFKSHVALIEPGIYSTVL